jgi:hypothetical protein
VTPVYIHFGWAVTGPVKVCNEREHWITGMPVNPIVTVTAQDGKPKFSVGGCAMQTVVEVETVTKPMVYTKTGAKTAIGPRPPVRRCSWSTRVQSATDMARRAPGGPP